MEKLELTMEQLRVLGAVLSRLEFAYGNSRVINPIIDQIISKLPPEAVEGDKPAEPPKEGVVL